VGKGVAAEHEAAEGDPAPAAAANASAIAGNADGDAAARGSAESNSKEEQSPWAARDIGTNAATRARAEGVADTVQSVLSQARGRI